MVKSDHQRVKEQQVIVDMSKVYLYVVARDYGFAPNPFHGFCTLATCKPAIRNTAKIGDWILGIGGTKLKATGKCIYAMKVTNKVTFNEYWTNPIFKDKKPIRNGSKKMMIGDNIYFNHPDNNWSQAHSHHSHIDGSLNIYNLERDTKSKFVLVSDHFYFFGSKSPVIPSNFLSAIGYYNKIGHRVYDYHYAKDIIDWLELNYGQLKNLIIGLPVNFDNSMTYYSVATDKVTKNENI